MATETSLTTRVTIWCLTAVTSIAGFFAIQNNNRLDEMKDLREQDKIRVESRDRTIAQKDRKIDSLNSVLLIRTDNSYEELKKFLKLEDKNSTITITPKKK